MSLFTNFMENISISFLLLNILYFFIYKSRDIVQFSGENISPVSFFLGVILSNKMYSIKNLLISKLSKNDSLVLVDKESDKIQIENKSTNTEPFKKEKLPNIDCNNTSLDIKEKVIKEINTNKDSICSEQLIEKLYFTTNSDNNQIDNEIFELTNKINNLDYKLKHIDFRLNNESPSNSSTPESDILDLVLNNMTDDELNNNDKKSNSLINSVSSLNDEIVADYLQPLTENKKNK